MCHLTESAQAHIERQESAPLECIHCYERKPDVKYIEGRATCERCEEEIEAIFNDLKNLED